MDSVKLTSVGVPCTYCHSSGFLPTEILFGNPMIFLIENAPVGDDLSHQYVTEQNLESLLSFESHGHRLELQSCSTS